MADLFTDLAVRAAGVAAAGLGWRPGEFWGATPAEMVMCLGGLRCCDALSAQSERGLAADDLAKLKERFPDG